MAKLSINEAAASGYTDVVGFDHVQLQSIADGTNPWSGATLAVAGEMPIGVIPAGGSMALVSVIEEVAFVGTTTCDINIGVTTTDPDEFINALSVDTMTTGVAVSNTGDVMVKSAATTTFAGGYLPVSSTAAAQTVILKVADLVAATAGRVLIGMKINDLAQFSKVNNV
tara:strand:- start:188 stop:694 length:507 start_codon:yes stop_codon:yes gene_type:complete